MFQPWTRRKSQIDWKTVPIVSTSLVQRDLRLDRNRIIVIKLLFCIIRILQGKAFHIPNNKKI